MSLMVILRLATVTQPASRNTLRALLTLTRVAPVISARLDWVRLMGM